MSKRKDISNKSSFGLMVFALICYALFSLDVSPYFAVLLCVSSVLLAAHALTALFNVHLTLSLLGVLFGSILAENNMLPVFQTSNVFTLFQLEELALYKAVGLPALFSFSCVTALLVTFLNLAFYGVRRRFAAPAPHAAS